MNGLNLIFLIVVFKDDDPVAVSAWSYPDDDMPLGCQELVRIDIAVKEKLPAAVHHVRRDDLGVRICPIDTLYGLRVRLYVAPVAGNRDFRPQGIQQFLTVGSSRAVVAEFHDIDFRHHACDRGFGVEPRDFFPVLVLEVSSGKEVELPILQVEYAAEHVFVDIRGVLVF